MMRRREPTLGRTYVEIGGSITLLYDNLQCKETLWLVEEEGVLQSPLWVRVSPYRFSRVRAQGVLDQIYERNYGEAKHQTRWTDCILPQEYVELLVTRNPWSDELRVEPVWEKVKRRILA